MCPSTLSSIALPKVVFDSSLKSPTSTLQRFLLSQTLSPSVLPTWLPSFSLFPSVISPPPDFQSEAALSGPLESNDTVCLSLLLLTVSSSFSQPASPTTPYPSQTFTHLSFLLLLLFTYLRQGAGRY